MNSRKDKKRKFSRDIQAPPEESEPRGWVKAEQVRLIWRNPAQATPAIPCFPRNDSRLPSGRQERPPREYRRQEGISFSCVYPYSSKFASIRWFMLTR
ncbi:hypothetical cytosolic protein [Syntrophus aciditrophicus SB]|uniref:Hypothetical cytosolic protein n=1 Tax=Syntrophus aciditrophicus (strain SB) TaxID=56780 RepID=Q2LPZ3_SYNAS|nr:hypothetical cytosolic protein [Syntrophus aciditrophicus SB]